MPMLGKIEETNFVLKTRETVSLSETLFVTHVTFIISRIFLGMVCVFKYITNKNIICVYDKKLILCNLFGKILKKSLIEKNTIVYMVFRLIS